MSLATVELVFDEGTVMTLFSLTLVGLRCLGIFFIVHSCDKLAEVSMLSALMDQLNKASGPPGMPYAHTAQANFFPPILESIVPLFIGGLLLAFARPLAVRINSGTEETKKTDYSQADVQGTAFAITGIVILTGILPKLGTAFLDILNWFYTSGAGRTDPIFGYRFARNHALGGIGVFAQLLVGLCLLLRPGSFRRFWHWLRTAGTGSRNP